MKRTPHPGRKKREAVIHSINISPGIFHHKWTAYDVLVFCKNLDFVLTSRFSLDFDIQHFQLLCLFDCAHLVYSFYIVFSTSCTSLFIAILQLLLS